MDYQPGYYEPLEGAISDIMMKWEKQVKYTKED